MSHPQSASPAGVSIRAPRDRDAAAIAALIASIEAGLYGRPEAAEGDVRFIWGWPHFDLDRDAWLVTAGDDAAGYAWVWGPRPAGEFDGSLQLALSDLGERAAPALLELMEARAREISRAAGLAETPSLGIPSSSRDQRKRAFLSASGYRQVRSFFRMERELAEPSPPPAWPVGVEVEIFRPGVDEAEVHDVIQDSFSDHYRFMPEPLEEWSRRNIRHPDFTPGLSLVTRHSGRAVAVSVNYAAGDDAWVGMLGVRRDWRKRGLATGLLLHSFDLFRRAGYRRACLGVDRENADGAPRIYEAVGMSVTRQDDFFQRRLA